jgi:hypothetical protein
MQSTGDLVTVIVEFPAGVQYGHDNFSGRTAFLVLRMNPGRNTPTIVEDADGIVGVNDYLDLVTVPRQRLVDGVVDYLEDHVVQTGTVAGIADVHAGTFTNRLQALENLDAVGVVF